MQQPTIPEGSLSVDEKEAARATELRKVMLENALLRAEARRASIQTFKRS